MPPEIQIKSSAAISCVNRRKPPPLPGGRILCGKPCGVRRRMPEQEADGRSRTRRVICHRGAQAECTGDFVRAAGLFPARQPRALREAVQGRGLVGGGACGYNRTHEVIRRRHTRARAAPRDSKAIRRLLCGVVSLRAPICGKPRHWHLGAKKEPQKRVALLLRFDFVGNEIT